MPLCGCQLVSKSMHDFVRGYLNRDPSTESFQSIVEQHMKPAMDIERNGRMDWFFREWVYGTEIPSYHMDYTIASERDGKYLFTGKVTQSGVSQDFLMSVPVYFDFDGNPVRRWFGVFAWPADIQRVQDPPAQEAEARSTECQLRRFGN
jgi:hypothetical protein